MSDEKKDQAPRQFDENQGLPPTKLKEGSFMNPRHAIFSPSLHDLPLLFG